MEASSGPCAATERRVSTESRALLERFSGWVDAGALRALDLAFTRFIAEQGRESDPMVLLAVALTSERNGHGHVCLDLRGALEAPEMLLSRLRDDAELSPRVRGELLELLDGLMLPEWVERLATSSVIAVMTDPAKGPLGDSDPKDEDGQPKTAGSPLVLAGSTERPLLYLRRYWQYEQRIRAGIKARLVQSIKSDASETAKIAKTIKELLDLLFAVPSSENPQSRPDCQRIACERAADRRFFIITGGPGTGKTTTVVRLLALLQRLAMPKDAKKHKDAPDARDAQHTDASPLRIELAAPTGKAAARLNESIAGQVHKLPGGEASWGQIPTQVKTLHRLLGTIPNSRHFRHHAANPLPADVVVVDEASMVDVELMAHLLDALRPDAQLILLGDKDQLSSVEAGAVLGDLCQPASQAHAGARGDPATPPCGPQTGVGLGQAIVILSHSYRFSKEGGIGALAELVNSNEASAPAPGQRLRAVLDLFNADPRPDLGVIEARVLTDTEDAGFAHLIDEAHGAEGSFLRQLRDKAPAAGADQAALNRWAGDLLKAQKRFQLLTPLRQGVWGVEGLNQRIIALLKQQGWLGREGDGAVSPRQWFAGRPVLVTRNDYSLNLMNGDIGITLPVPVMGEGAQNRNAASALRVAFPTVEGGVRWVLPSRLQAVETVFAMTVHKSQGSEFEHTALILPDRPNPVLTRELLYTAITRAKERFTLLYSQEAVLREALTRRVERVSGLQGAWV